MQIVQPPFFVRAIFPNAVWRISTTEKVVYLTFDDGPTPVVTEEVLNLLQQYKAKATFFCIGENVQKFQKIYQRILEEGHSVGNHTFNHLKGILTPNQTYFSNIEQCKQLVQSNLFRPPYGRMKISQYKHLQKKYNIILWDTLSWDFDANVTPQQCAKNVIRNVKHGSIVVFHDSLKAQKNCIVALEQTLKTLSMQGYVFKNIPSSSTNLNHSFQ